MRYPIKHSFINIHSHRKPVSKGEWVLRNAYTLPYFCFYENPPYALSAGIHPRHVRIDNRAQLNKLKQLAPLKNVLAIGIIGLDNLASASMKLQKEIFEEQLAIAEEVHKPVLIHAVHTYNELLPYVKKSTIPFIFNHFEGNAQQASRLAEAGAYFSFGRGLMQNTPEMIETFELLPLDRIFLETDLMHLPIEQVYQKTARIKGVMVETLQEKIYNNFTTVFSA